MTMELTAIIARMFKEQSGNWLKILAPRFCLSLLRC